MMERSTTGRTPSPDEAGVGCVGLSASWLRALVFGGSLAVLALTGCAGATSRPQSPDGSERALAATVQAGAETAAQPGITEPVDSPSAAAQPAAAEPAAALSAARGGRAMSLAERGLARGDGSAADEALRLGDEAWRQERWEEALGHFERARQLAPRDPAPWVGVARARSGEAPLAYGAAQDDEGMQTALNALERALTLQDDFALALFEKGRISLALGRALEARRLLEGIAESFPDDAEAQSSLGVALLASGDPRGARERLERAARLEPDRAERFANLGTAQMMAGDVESAVRSYRSAVRLAPGSAQHQNDLGTALLGRGDLEAAMEHLGRAVVLEPERATFLSNLAYAHLAGGRNEEALRIARRATTLDPKLGSAWINLGTAAARLGRMKDARSAIRRALDLDPTDPRARAIWEELDELEASSRD